MLLYYLVELCNLQLTLGYHLGEHIRLARHTMVMMVVLCRKLVSPLSLRALRE